MVREWVLPCLLTILLSGCIATGDDEPRPGATEATAESDVCTTINGLEYRCEARPPGQCYVNMNGQEHDCLLERFVEVTLVDGPFEIMPTGGSSYSAEVPPHVIGSSWDITIDAGAVEGLKASGACNATPPSYGAVSTNNLWVQTQGVSAGTGSVVLACGPLGAGERTFGLDGAGFATGTAVLGAVVVELADPSWAPPAE